MDSELFFPPFDATAAMWPLVAGLLMLVFVVGGVAIAMSVGFGAGFSRKVRVAVPVLGLFFALVGVFIFTSMLADSDAKEERNAAIRENRQAFMKDRGVYIPDSEWENLDFPWERPTKDEKFGIAQAEYEGKVVSVLLAWENGELKLYSTDSEELRPVR